MIVEFTLGGAEAQRPLQARRKLAAVAADPTAAANREPKRARVESGAARPPETRCERDRRPARQAGATSACRSTTNSAIAKQQRPPGGRRRARRSCDITPPRSPRSRWRRCGAACRARRPRLRPPEPARNDERAQELAEAGGVADISTPIDVPCSTWINAARRAAAARGTSQTARSTIGPRRMSTIAGGTPARLEHDTDAATSPAVRWIAASAAVAEARRRRREPQRPTLATRTAARRYNNGSQRAGRHRPPASRSPSRTARAARWRGSRSAASSASSACS